MLRRSAIRKTVPCHPVIPGNFSHRGFLYRNSNQNYHSRMVPMLRTQMTWEETYRRDVLLPHPTLALFVWAIVPFYFVTMYFFSADTEYGPDEILPSRGVKSYDLNPENVMKRNRQLLALFEGHRNLFAEIRAETGTPDVMQPPKNSNYRDSMIKA